MHIAIAGNIGVGKTTLTSMLAKHYGWEPNYEVVDDNPYLNDFYQDMKAWSFNVQISYLHSRLQNIMNIRSSGKDVIQDRTIYEDAYIFAPNLHGMKLMATRDFETYFSLFRQVEQLLQAPDLLIYLKASIPTLVKRIQSKGREYENAIRLDYLESLNRRYETWVKSYDLGKILVIDTDSINFIDNPDDFSKIVNKIDAELYGLFTNEQ
ncbi:MAG: deoxynucleoside kinase [Bacteroidales bacterium]|jgi:deoxyadenosine/deoxycytidine kinase|nr:deoxynucleoside kinase [Bacteroidales bacterium]MBP5724743.1 deoxynucleoside kinase [Bacteroidales bacterium]MBQ3675895.1 deoxynucleoside kinase [Bacteroidales bacterium]MBR4498446.1 deoxynucleoside kinase [Bacteroidales bacterium]MBR4690398.1 deoxynucleoside kinase [Bacteroidales bacterium]